MDYNYLSSVFDFYLQSESETSKAELEITKEHEKVFFKLGMSSNQNEKSVYELSLSLANNYMNGLLKEYKGDLMVIDESYNLNNLENTCAYYVKLKNGRSITVQGFSVIEVNNIRNILHNITLNKEEIRVDLEQDEKIKMNYEPSLQETGYASFSQLFLIVLFIADIIAVGLWIFISFLK